MSIILQQILIDNSYQLLIFINTVTLHKAVNSLLVINMSKRYKRRGNLKYTSEIAVKQVEILHWIDKR